LQQVEGFENPIVDLEQYETPANLAADIIFAAGKDAIVMTMSCCIETTKPNKYIYRCFIWRY
jgi:hypothetical protein